MDVFDPVTFRLAWCREHSVVMATELLPPRNLARGTLFQSSCVIPTSPMVCSDDTFFGKHEHGALWLLICGATEKHLLTNLTLNPTSPDQVVERSENEIRQLETTNYTAARILDESVIHATDERDGGKEPSRPGRTWEYKGQNRIGRKHWNVALNNGRT